MADTDVAVIGGGIGGLTTALALRERGIRAEVFERAPDLREVGAAVALSANGTRVLEGLGLGERLAACSAIPDELIYRHWRNGNRVASHAVGSRYRERFGAAYYGVHRADLQGILVDAWGEVHLDREVVGLVERDEDVRIDFADGRSRTARRVVGADGVRSTVRKLLTGSDQDAVYSGTTGFRGLIPLDQLSELPDPRAIQFWMGPGGHLLHYPIGDGGLVNFLAVVEGPEQWPDESWVRAVGAEEIASAFEGWHPAVRQMVGATSLHQRWALFSHPPLSRWSRGRVVLLGDAAHAMLPHHGQGANQTIEDAVVLADCLAESTVDSSAALRRYEKLRRTRTRQVQRSSWVASDLLHLPDDASGTRDQSLVDIHTTIDWIHGYDAGAVVRS